MSDEFIRQLRALPLENIPRERAEEARRQALAAVAAPAFALPRWANRLINLGLAGACIAQFWFLSEVTRTPHRPEVAARTFETVNALASACVQNPCFLFDPVAEAARLAGEANPAKR